MRRNEVSMSRQRIAVAIASLVVCASTVAADYPDGFWERMTSLPEKGAVVRAQTAIRIAEAVWLEKYGKGIYRTRPFRAELSGNEWRVSGTAADEDGAGGIPCARIDARDGRILGMMHTQ
jgi:hypothetical protein